MPVNIFCMRCQRVVDKLHKDPKLRYHISQPASVHIFNRVCKYCCSSSGLTIEFVDSTFKDPRAEKIE